MSNKRFSHRMLDGGGGGGGQIYNMVSYMTSRANFTTNIN